MTYLQKNPASPAPMQPFFRAPSGFAIPNGCAVAAFACAASIIPCSAICAMTRLRRSNAASGCATGSNWVVDRTIPASIAACGTVSWSAVVLKYVRAAAEIP